MTSTLNIILFGPPGAGKGTQATLLKEQLGLNHISSGDLFRHHLKTNSPLGIKAAEFMNSGLLVPDDLTIEIILDKLCNVSSKQGFMLDGFPRTISQAKALSTQMDKLSLSIDAVIFINVKMTNQKLLISAFKSTAMRPFPSLSITKAKVYCMISQELVQLAKLTPTY